MPEGFARVDRIAKEMASSRPRSRSRPPSSLSSPSPPPRRASRRSPAVRWASIGLLAAAGAAGALYFVAGSSPKKPPAAEVLGGPSPMGAAPSLQLSTGDARAARAAQIAVVLDDIDATLHSMRLTWPGQLTDIKWRGPGWLDAARLERDLAALDSQLAGADDPVSSHTRAWIAVARSDGASLLRLHAAWIAPGASADALGAELRPIFDRLVVASQAVHAAVAADLQPPAPGTMAAVGTACRVAPLLARLPLRGPGAGRPIVEQGGAPPSAVPLVEPAEPELRAHAEACLDATRAFLAANPGEQLDHNDIYQLSLATQISLNLLHEADRRRAPADGRVFVSTAGNLAQESAYLATARRRRDPSLRPAEAPPP